MINLISHKIAITGVSISTVFSSTKTDWKCSQKPCSQSSSVLRGCFPPHPIFNNHQEQTLLVTYLHPFQFSQLNCFTRFSHRQLDHSISLCLCRLIVQHVCPMLYFMPSGTVVMLSVVCEQGWAGSPNVGVVCLLMRCLAKSLLGEAGVNWWGF